MGPQLQTDIKMEFKDIYNYYRQFYESNVPSFNVILDHKYEYQNAIYSLLVLTHPNEFTPVEKNGLKFDWSEFKKNSNLPQFRDNQLNMYKNYLLTQYFK